MDRAGRDRPSRRGLHGAAATWDGCSFGDRAMARRKSESLEAIARRERWTAQDARRSWRRRGARGYRCVSSRRDTQSMRSGSIDGAVSRGLATSRSCLPRSRSRVRSRCRPTRESRSSCVSEDLTDDPNKDEEDEARTTSETDPRRQELAGLNRWFAERDVFVPPLVTQHNGAFATLFLIGAKRSDIERVDAAVLDAG